MELVFGVIAAVGGFFASLFGGTPPVQDVSTPVVAEAPIEVAATTSAPLEVPPVAVPAAKPQPMTVIAVPTPVAPVASSTPIATSTTATSTLKSTGGSSTNSAELSIEGNLKNVTEKDVIILTALFAGTDVTSTASWEVVGPIGSVSKGVFTAKLSATLAEFGHAPGAVVARYTDPATSKEVSAETPIFEVEAYIPEDMTTTGQ